MSAEDDLNTSVIENRKITGYIKKRGVIKAKLTLFKKFISNLRSLRQPLSAEQLLDIELRLEKITAVFKEFESIQDKIETICTEVEPQLLERESFENTYYECVSFAKGCLKQAGTSSNPSQREESVAVPSESVKYPDITLPSFSGNFINWLEFRDSFDALVNQTNLKPIQKFKYLRSSLTGGALEVISSLEYSDESYAIAWQLLCERYNNPRVLVNNHLRALFHINTVPTQPLALRSLADNISKHLRTLRSLSISVECWDLLVIFFLVSKLEAPLQRKWEEKTNSREIPTLQEFKSFLRAQADLQESWSHMGEEQAGRHGSKALLITSSPPQPNNKVTIPKFTNRSQCAFCKGSHYINQCPNFLAQNVASRIRTIKRLGICFNCLGSNHILPNCRASNCRTCKGKHHTLLHITQPNSNPSTSSSIPQPSTIPRIEPNPLPESQTVNLLTNSQPTHTLPSQTDGNKLPTQVKSVILSTARISVFDKDNKLCVLRALLDSGSQSNYVTEAAVRKLRLPTCQIDMEVVGFNENVTKINQLCNLSLQSNDKKFTTEISCFIVPNICSLPSHATNVQSLIIPKRFKLADESFFEGGEIDLILGAELFYQLMCIGQHKLGENLPILQRTKLGWVVSGAITTVNKPKQVRCNFVLNRELKSVWDDDEWHKQLPHDDDTVPCEKIFATHKRTSDGKFVVSLPLKEPVASLGLSRPAVYKRFMSLEAKFARNPEYKDKYVKFMQEFKDSGHMIKTKETETCNFLPHHAILNPEKTTTPLRVVMDASFKTNTGMSLNDIQYKGTINQDDLVNILLRFRTNRYVVIADIEKMYRMIYINPEQRNMQCILWRDNPNEPLTVYQLTTLSFGLKCAPYLATRCLLQLADEHKNRFPRASDAITKDFYIDDFIHGGDDEQQVTETAVHVNEILSSAKFYLRKWKSNSKNILNTVTNHTNTQSQNTHTALGPDTQKVLGLAWRSDGDYLMYTLKREPVPKQLTKRKILSIISAIFDPLGLLGPVLIVAKCFIQRLWKNKSDWDDVISNELSIEWITFYNKLPILNSLALPRYALSECYVTIEVHGFADSSLTAYGAAIYMRCIDKYGHITLRLLCSKNRLARNETIPKLELRAACLLANLHDKVNNALKCKIQNRYFWSDSNVALAWIRSQPDKLNCFIKNRVIEIQKLTDTKNWFWVPSSENPADLLTRGVSAEKLEGCKLWWEGPSWLRKPTVHWPSQQIPTAQALRNNDVADSAETYCNVSINIQPNAFMTSLFQKWSSFSKLNHCFAFMLRFIHNCKNKTNKLIGPLTVTELKDASNKLIKFAQIESFPNEYKLLQDKKSIQRSSKLINLNPYIHNGIMRVGGRLGRSHYNYEKKHPIILPQKHDLTYLITHREHVRLLHAGPQLLLASIRERFWPIHGKKIVNKVVRECVTCFRAKPSITTPIMGNLPPSRVTPSPPFQTTSVDYAGPFLIRDRRGRGYKVNKCYIAVFVCSSTKAVHIELVSGLDTLAFLSAYRRFISRRGRPREMLSDNGSNFHGADREITELYNFLKENPNELITSLAEEGISWKFIPVYTPHMGGLHEAFIKKCKFHLKRTLGQALLTYEEFATVLIQIEAILNSRPLCPISNSSIDNFDILTPAHFLVGRTPVSMPDYDYTDVPTNRLTHYQQLQQLQQGFWRRWSRDYIGQLQERTKWRSCKGPDLRIGTMVLVKEDRVPPCLWRLGRIVGCCQGRDGVTRVAEIQTARGLIKRAFNNICPLPINGVD